MWTNIHIYDAEYGIITSQQNWKYTGKLFWQKCKNKQLVYVRKEHRKLITKKGILNYIFS